MNICRKYENQIQESLGKKEGKTVIRRRIIQVHKMEACLPLKNGKIGQFFRIAANLLTEILRNVLWNQK